MANDHPFDNDFSITCEQRERLQKDGFVKLEGFFNAGVVETLLARVDVEMSRQIPTKFKADSRFSRVQYDFESDRNEVFELLERPYFRRALTELVERDLFLTAEICFEIEKNVNKGFPWHVGVQSFGCQRAEEFACTVWAPLHPVDTQGQRGGMACVPERVVSGNFVFQYFESAIVSTLEAKEHAGKETNFFDYLDMRGGFLNSPPMGDVLEYHQIEDDFAPGDVLLFNKNVIHKSVGLREGVLPRRAAHVMRFVDAGSHYDLKGAQTLEFPVRQYGERVGSFVPFARQHIEIAEAGAQDGDVLANCAYFSDRDRRTVQRERSPQP